MTVSLSIVQARTDVDRIGPDRSGVISGEGVSTKERVPQKFDGENLRD